MADLPAIRAVRRHGTSVRFAHLATRCAGATWAGATWAGATWAGIAIAVGMSVIAPFLSSVPAARAETLSEIDIAVGYTNETLQAFDNDRARLQRHVLALRNSTNAILQASGAPVRLNIVGLEATRDFRQSTFGADRQRFINATGGGEALERLRDRAGADVRLLLVNYGGRGSRVHYGGLFDARRSRSEILRNAYVMIGTNAGAMTFAHEVGHVLGCQHARRQPCLGARGGALPFAYGFRSPEGIGTIMAGSCATRELVPLFSNPALAHRFTPDGAREEKVIKLGSETADCVRAMTNNAPILATLNDRKGKVLGEPGGETPIIADLKTDK